MKELFLFTISVFLFSYCLTAQTDTTINGVTYNLFAPGLWVEEEASAFTCGDDVTFMYNGSMVTYGTVESAGGLCWMDRNLGASQVATSSNDAAAYGDLFQWGRGDDGHQDRSIGGCNPTNCFDAGEENLNLPPNASVSGAWDGMFIYNMQSPFDWHQDNPDNSLWQGVNGSNNPCPSGWRVPTEDEWDTERMSWAPMNAVGALASPLKLPLAGQRQPSSGALAAVGSAGNYWSSDIPTINSRFLFFNSSSANIFSTNQARGGSVRCIKDE